MGSSSWTGHGQKVWWGDSSHPDWSNLPQMLNKPPSIPIRAIEIPTHLQREAETITAGSSWPPPPPAYPGPSTWNWSKPAALYTVTNSPTDFQRQWDHLPNWLWPHTPAVVTKWSPLKDCPWSLTPLPQADLVCQHELGTMPDSLHQLMTRGSRSQLKSI